MNKKSKNLCGSELAEEQIKERLKAKLKAAGEDSYSRLKPFKLQRKFKKTVKKATKAANRDQRKLFDGDVEAMKRMNQKDRNKITGCAYLFIALVMALILAGVVLYSYFKYIKPSYDYLPESVVNEERL